MQPAENIQLEQYGAISPLAIFALILGIASVAALVGLGLLFVPLAAIGVALAALVRISASEGALVGRPIAVAGLILALLFASIAVTRAIARESLVNGRAQQFADEWLELVRQGDVEMAHQLHLPAAQRQLPGTQVKDFYIRGTSARDELDVFFAGPMVSEIVNAPQGAKVRFQKMAAHLPDDNYDRFDMLYELQLPNGKTKPFLVVVERAQSDDGGRWRMAAVTSPQPDGAN